MVDGKLLSERIKNLPERPGVYLMKDNAGALLYIGKAISLKARVRSYFQDEDRLSGKVRALMRRVADLDVIVTDTEVEALILEATLIKRHRPRYNIQLKDDKSYPYLRITWEEDFPRLLVARRPTEGQSRYFGPFPRAGQVHETIRLLRRIFPLRNCTNPKFKNAARPCLEYHIKRCQAPCQGLVDRETYRNTVRRVERVLEGRADEVIQDLGVKLKEAAGRLQFEQAAEYRDQIRALEAITEQQKVAGTAGRDVDAVAWAVTGGVASGQVFTVREGRLVGRETFLLEGIEEGDDPDIARAFLTQYYERASHVPAEVLVPALPEDLPAVVAWLSGRRAGRVRISIPRRGEKAQLLAMVRQNAELVRAEMDRRQASADRDRTEALLGMRYALGLDGPPIRMECYDISNTQGTESVASMVVFTQGHPDKSQYRRFKIQSVVGPDDFRSMAEVIRRRFTHRELAAGQHRPDLKKFAHWPDLVIVDGGKGQLSAAVAVLRELNVSIPIFGLAKEHEWLYAPDRSDPIILDMNSPALKILRHLRDEAHRFAITFHRKLRTQRNLRSLLDEVPGIGPIRKREILRAYPNLDAVRAAPVQELARLPGMNHAVAEALHAFLAQAEVQA